MTDSTQTAAPMQNWKLTLAYDGTEFRGWQVQPGERTIQGELQASLARVTGESPLPQGSGRTDAGVHALGQVASFALQAPIPPANLQRALNRTLPEAIRVLDARTVPDAFHARHSAVTKTYEYRVFVERPAPWLDGADAGASCPPFLARYVYAFPWPLEMTALQKSAAQFVGQHDFLSFAATDPDLATRGGVRGEHANHEQEPATAIRTIFSSAWEPRHTENGQLLVYRVQGNGFLHHMVRNLVGTMLDAGRGYLGPEAIPAMLAARSRSATGPTAPAR